MDVAIASAWEMVKAPLKEDLKPEERTEVTTQLSEMVIRVATHVICHTLVDYAGLLSDERISIAHAFLQRVTSTQMCNHKLTAEGLVYQYKGQEFELHEEYKTMTLTRTVYEHLVVFYFLFEYPKTGEEFISMWKYWKRTGQIELAKENGKRERLSYSKAWKYLFANEELSLLYSHLSMHCHPVYSGLKQYQSQSPDDEGNDWVPLYLSSCFVAYLCRLFLKLIPHGDEVVKKGFSMREQAVFYALSNILLTGSKS
ncbi:MAG: hypothetical protein IJ902_00375 [Prevotella sp.]|jgi:hypothetical protein|nr:hypothetical protein [Prevotella sp.]